MSRSRKKAIIKDRPRKKTNIYHKTIRSATNQVVRELAKLEEPDELEIPSPKNIINDYNYCDWIFDAEHSDGKWAKENKTKLRRK